LYTEPVSKTLENVKKFAPGVGIAPSAWPSLHTASCSWH